MSECEYCDWEGLRVCAAEREDGYQCTRPLGHEGPHVACGTNVHECRAWEAAGERAVEEAAPERKFTVLHWEWGQAPEWDEFNDALREYANPQVADVDHTGTSDAAIVITDGRLSPKEAQELFDEWSRQEWED